MELDRLLGEISGDAPSGADLEYDPEYEALALAAEVRDSQQIGDEVLEAKPPDYEDVRDKALALLGRAHDLRVALHLAQAELSTRGFAGFADVLDYIRRCLETRWETCHPQLDHDDDDDPTMRVNVVRGLVDATGILRSVQRAPITDSRAFGRFSFRDFEIASGARSAPSDMETPPSMASISAAIRDTDPQKLAQLRGHIARAREMVEGIDAIFTDRIPGQGPDLQPLKSMLSVIHGKIGELSGAEDAEPAGGADMPEAAATAVSSGGAAPKAGFSGAVNGPDDVVKALDQILSYYARSEPSSPLPILIKRAKRLVRADFLTIMKDMAPEGIGNVRLVGGLSDEDVD